MDFRLRDLKGHSQMHSRGVEYKQFRTQEKEETFQLSNDSAVGLKTQLVLFVFSFPSLPSPFPLFPLYPEPGKGGKEWRGGHGAGRSCWKG